LNTIAISIIHFDPARNHGIYLPYKKEYIDLQALIRHVHDCGFSARLTCVLADGFICNAASLSSLISFARENGVEQLTVSPVTYPARSNDETASRWTEQHHLREENLEEIRQYLARAGVPVMELMHGATVYDVNGQIVCLSSCLTLNRTEMKIRHLIFFPDGHLRYDWQHEGAILL
jgi:hypothetical protein